MMTRSVAGGAWMGVVRHSEIKAGFCTLVVVVEGSLWHGLFGDMLQRSLV